MALGDKLQRASFRDISFLVESESVSRGKKIAIHEYPNSDTRYVEELGKLPPIFTLKAIVHGIDAVNQRLNLENALEQPGFGLLSHPIYGKLSVKALDFSVDSGQTEIGIFSFSIRFSQSRSEIAPTPSASSETTIKSLSSDLKETLDEKLEDLYEPPTSPFNFDTVVDSIQGAFDSVKDNINAVVELSTTGAAAFNRIYRTVTNNITSIVASAQTFRENVSLFYQSALDAGVFIDQLGAAWDNLIDYPFTVATSSPITDKQRENLQDQTLIAEHLKLTALVNAYEAKAYTEFTTETELSLARKFLDISYRTALNDLNEQIADVELVSLGNDQDVRAQLAELRVAARKVFDQKEKAVYKITDISPGLSSMALTAFRYYGSLDLIDQLIELNPDINNMNFRETIKALAG